MIDPILVPPKDGFKAIGVGTTKGYELINSGDLEAVKIGTATRLTVESIKAYAARLVAEKRAAA